MKRFILIALAAALVTPFFCSCEKTEPLIHYPVTASDPGDEVSPMSIWTEDGSTKQSEKTEPAQDPGDNGNTDNVFLLVHGPQSLTVTAVILNSQMHFVSKTLNGTVEVFSWFQETATDTAVLSIEYEDCESAPRRFTFCPTDSEWFPTLKDNIAAGKTSTFTVNLYTDEVTVI